MIEPATFHAVLVRHGLTFFTGVPDSLLKDLCAYVADNVPSSDHVIAANEGAAVALAAGYHLGTGKTPVVYMQNSGLGNAINPLLSLADPAVYAVPMVVLVGWRGEPAVPDEPQHVTQGRVMEAMLQAIEVPYDIVDESTDVERLIADVIEELGDSPRPRVLLVRKGTFASYWSEPPADAMHGLDRGSATNALLDAVPSDAVIVATTGFTSRELFGARERRGESRARDFLTVGSMGHASQIAVGLAAQHPERPVICLDGDGATLMHMGSLAINGTRGSANFHHVVLNNGAHDSVGGQPTAAASVDLTGVARSCGYRVSGRARTVDELAGMLEDHLGQEGPTFLEIILPSEPTTTAGRPTSTPVENKLALMRELGAD